MARAFPAALVVSTLLFGGGAAAGGSSPCPGAGDLGAVAYVQSPEATLPKPNRGGSLRVLDLRTCRLRVLVSSGVQPPVRWSYDGRWLAFGEGSVVRASGGEVVRPIGAVRNWEWAPRADVLAGVTEGGGVVVGGPENASRRLLPDGSRADNVAFEPAGRRIAIGRDRPSEIVVINVGSGSVRVLRRFSSRYAGVTVAGWSRDDRWILFWGPYAGASIAADGAVLHAVAVVRRPLSTLVKASLLYDDYLSWCSRSQLVVSAGSNRFSTSGKTLIAVTAPRWRARKLTRRRTLSWVNPACSPSGRTVAAAAGRNFSEPRFGLEHRSIWLLPSRAGRTRQLTTAPAGATDERPMWSRDGLSLLFVRTRDFSGALYVARLDGRLVGPVAQLGSSAPYYGHYDWASRLDWYRR